MPDAAFFRPDLFNFLRQLKRHNNREWFAKNKQRYEEAVRDPALLFIENFGPRLHSLSPHFVADPRLTRGSWAWSEGSAGRWMTSRAIAGDDTGVSAYGLIQPGTIAASGTGLKPAIDFLDMLTTPAGVQGH